MRPSTRQYHLAVLVLVSLTIHRSAHAVDLNLFFRDQSATVGTSPNPAQQYSSVISRRSNEWKPITTATVTASPTPTLDVDPMTFRPPIHRVVVANRGRPMLPPPLERQTQPRPRNVDTLQRWSNEGVKRTKKATLNEEDLVRTFYADEQSGHQPAADQNEGHRDHIFDNNDDNWEGDVEVDGPSSNRDDRQNSYQVHEEVDEGGNRVDDFKHTYNRPTIISLQAQTFTTDKVSGFGSDVRRNSTVGARTTAENRRRRPPAIAATSSKRIISSQGRDRREFEGSTNETSEDWPSRSFADDDDEWRKVESNTTNDEFTKLKENSVSSNDDYYAQLFDSFGKGDENGVDDRQATSTRHTDDEPFALPSSSLTLFARRPDDTQSSAYKSEKRAAVAHETATTPTPPTPSSLRKSEVDGWPLMFGHWMNSTSFELRNLIPPTLRENIVSVRRLLVECWSFADTKDGSNVDRKTPSTSCFKKITFDILDKAIEAEVVKLTDTVSLVRENKSSETGDKSGTSRSFSYDNVGNEISEWLPHLVDKIQQLFSTHSLKVKLNSVAQQTENFQVEGRRRHAFRRIFPVVASIYMAFTAVVIPLVFQFMAMMGGKALVVGKIALFFALYNAFNKFVAGTLDGGGPSSYHAPPPPPPPPASYPYAPHSPYDHSINRRKSDKSYATTRVPLDYTYFTLE